MYNIDILGFKMDNGFKNVLNISKYTSSIIIIFLIFLIYNKISKGYLGNRK